MLKKFLRYFYRILVVVFAISNVLILFSTAQGLERETPIENTCVIFEPYAWDIGNHSGPARETAIHQNYRIIAEFIEDTEPGSNPSVTLEDFKNILEAGFGLGFFHSHASVNGIAVESYSGENAIIARDAAFDRYNQLPEYTGKIYRAASENGYHISVNCEAIRNWSINKNSIAFVKGCHSCGFAGCWNAYVVLCYDETISGFAGADTFFHRLDGIEDRSQKTGDDLRRAVEDAVYNIEHLQIYGDGNITLAPIVVDWSPKENTNLLAEGDGYVEFNCKMDTSKSPENILTADGAILNQIEWENNHKIKFHYKITGASAEFWVHSEYAVSANNINLKLDGNQNPKNKNGVGPAGDDFKWKVTLSPYVDVVLVIDRSGSMSDYWFGYYDPKITAAKSSAKMFVDLMQVNDKVGVVDFDDIITITYSLTRIDKTSSVKTAAKAAIDTLYARGATSIGGGLQTAQNQLTTKGADDPVWAIVLLSDGWENTPPYVKDVLPSIAATKTRIYTIGLGQGADEALLNTIALTTGGFYRFSPSGTELAAIYQDIQRAVAGLQGIVSYLSNILQGVTKSFSVGIDSSVLRAVFTATIGGSDIDLVLIAPDGTVIDPSVAATDPNITFTSGDNYESYSIISPMSGTWQMQVSGVDVAPSGEQITVSVSGSTDLTLDIDFDKIEYLPDEPITIIAELKDSLGPILGASVMANVTTPSTADTLTLYDDGLHQDGAANDGVYANSYTNTSQRGSYTFKVDASGISNRGENFTRTATKSTVVGRDSDNDGMPDVWEDIYGLNKYEDDAGEDPDNDGLTNLEEYLNRTNPKNWDTDGDGYSDGEEVAKGSDPLNPNSVPAITGDLDNDGDVDQNDLNLLLTYRNQPASACPECDIDGDGVITVLDARKLVLMCTRPRCATE